MELLVRCTCGYEIRSQSEPDLIDQTQTHAHEAHDLQLSDDQVRDIMEVIQ